MQRFFTPDLKIFAKANGWSMADAACKAECILRENADGDNKFGSCAGFCRVSGHPAPIFTCYGRLLFFGYCIYQYMSLAETLLRQTHQDRIGRAPPSTIE